MNIHDSDISKSINLNIIGTCNIVKACKKNNIKLISQTSKELNNADLVEEASKSVVLVKTYQ